MSTLEPQEPPPQEPPPKPPQVDANRSQRAIAWLALILAVVIIAVGTAPFWAPALVPVLPWGQRAAPATAAENADTGAIRDLRARLDTDEAALKEQQARLARLEASPAPAPAAPPPVAVVPPANSATPQSQPNADAVKALQDQVAKLSADQTTSGTRLGQLEAKVATVGEQGRADRRLLTAVGALRVAVEGAGPYEAELAAAREAAGNNSDTQAALASLGDDAKAGLPSTAALAERFDHAVAPAILRARRDDPHADWWTQIRARLERLVVVRRVAPGGAVPRDATEAAVSKTDAALRAGDLAAAAVALDGLTGDAAKAAAPWLAQAKKRVAAEAALAKLWRDEIARAGDKR